MADDESASGSLGDGGEIDGVPGVVVDVEPRTWFDRGGGFLQGRKSESSQLLDDDEVTNERLVPLTLVDSPISHTHTQYTTQYI